MEARAMRARSQRGFTLTELMVVVAMVSVLALLAVYGVRKYISASKATEPVYMIGLIKTSQEAWREEFHVYYNVSQSNLDAYYPDAPDAKSRNFNNPSHPDVQAWLNLGVATPNPVRYGYATVAGAATDGKPNTGTSCCGWVNDGEPWFVVKAAGDNNADGNKSYFIGSSQTQEIYAQAEEE